MEVERHYFNNGGEEISPSRGENLSKLIPEKKRSFLILDRKERKKVVPRDKFSNVESILRNFEISFENVVKITRIERSIAALKDYRTSFEMEAHISLLETLGIKRRL